MHNIPHTEKSKQKMREKTILRWQNPEYRKYMSTIPIGRKVSEETRKKISLAHKGKPETLQTRLNISLGRRGNKTNLWKGGVTPINKLLRSSSAFKIWREQIFKRDDYICQECKQKGNYLHPHHIKSFVDYPELKFDIDNGITLCADCHQKKHTSCLTKEWRNKKEYSKYYYQIHKDYFHQYNLKNKEKISNYYKYYQPIYRHRKQKLDTAGNPLENKSIYEVALV